MSGLNRSHTNLTVEWQPTPPDLPTSYNVSQKSQLCKPDPNHNISNMTNSLIIADWDDPIADTDSVCTIANTSLTIRYCQPGELINANRERNRNRTTEDRSESAQNRAPKRRTASPVSFVMLLAAVAATAYGDADMWALYS